MKISELIAKLEEVKKEHGDLIVYYDASDYDTVDYPIEGEIVVREEIKETLDWGKHILPEPKRVVIG